MLNPNLIVRAGFAFDESPVNNDYRSLALPDNHRRWYSAGFTYALNDIMSIDAAYTYIDSSETHVNETSLLGTQYEGNTQGRAQVTSLQFNWQL